MWTGTITDQTISRSSSAGAGEYGEFKNKRERSRFTEEQSSFNTLSALILHIFFDNSREAMHVGF